MIHTDSVAEVQDEGKRLANNRNLLEKFSICPVYTGMSLTPFKRALRENDLPRTHGDEPMHMNDIWLLRYSAPYARG